MKLRGTLLGLPPKLLQVGFEVADELVFLHILEPMPFTDSLFGKLANFSAFLLDLSQEPQVELGLFVFELLLFPPELQFIGPEDLEGRGLVFDGELKLLKLVLQAGLGLLNRFGLRFGQAELELLLEFIVQGFASSGQCFLLGAENGEISFQLLLAGGNLPRHFRF